MDVIAAIPRSPAFDMAFNPNTVATGALIFVSDGKFYFYIMIFFQIGETIA
jgi:hypothetical protein